jgi:hypothetical protein
MIGANGQAAAKLAPLLPSHIFQLVDATELRLVGQVRLPYRQGSECSFCLCLYFYAPL